MTFFQPALFVSEGENVTIDATPELQDGSASSYTFSIDIGAARSSRRIFLAIHWSEGGTHRTLSSCTINGVTANRFQDGHSGGATGFGCAIASALVPTGSGNVDVGLTFSGTVSGVLLTSVRTVGLTGSSATDTAFDENSGVASDLSDTIDVPSDGFLMAVYTGSTNTTGRSVTWTGATEIYDQTGPSDPGDSNDPVRCSLAISSGLSSQTGRAIEAAIIFTSDSGNAFVAETWT